MYPDLDPDLCNSSMGASLGHVAAFHQVLSKSLQDLSSNPAKTSMAEVINSFLCTDTFHMVKLRDLLFMIQEISFFYQKC